METIDRATVKVCWNGSCGSTTPNATDASHSAPGTFRLAGPSFSGSGLLIDEGDGWTRMDVSVTPAGQLTDGDRYSLSIVDTAGTSLLDVERLTTYSISYPNGPQCDPGCQTATHALYTESTTGLSCTGNTCDAGVVFRETIPVDADLSAVNVVACRNDTCWPNMPIRLSEGSANTWMKGPPGSIGVTRMAPERADFVVKMQGETAALADGDRYRLTITDARTQRTLVNIDRQVTYEATFPNGQACDAHPCRIARIEGP